MAPYGFLLFLAGPSTPRTRTESSERITGSSYLKWVWVRPQSPQVRRAGLGVDSEESPVGSKERFFVLPGAA